MRMVGAREECIWGVELTGCSYGLAVDGEEKRRVKVAPGRPGARCLFFLISVPMQVPTYLGKPLNLPSEGFKTRKSSCIFHILWKDSNMYRSRENSTASQPACISHPAPEL